MFKTMRHLFLFSTISSLWACGAEAPSQQETSPANEFSADELLADIQLSDTYKIEFRQNARGHVLLTEDLHVDLDGRSVLSGLDLGRMTLAAIYQAAAPADQIDAAALERLRNADQAIADAAHVSTPRDPRAVLPIDETDVAPANEQVDKSHATGSVGTVNCAADAGFFNGFISATQQARPIDGSPHHCFRGTGVMANTDSEVSFYESSGFNQNFGNSANRSVQLEMRVLDCDLFIFCSWEVIGRAAIDLRHANHFAVFANEQFSTRMIGSGGNQPPGAIWSHFSAAR